MSVQPAVSVIIPVYNRAALLPLAMQSVFAQTFQDFEIIVADDGSTDGTLAALGEWRRDPRVRIVELEHSGNPAIVRNAALRAARAATLAFLDSDDLWMPDKLTRQLSLLREQPVRRWGYTGFLHIDAAGQIIDDDIGRHLELPEGDIFAAVVMGRASIRTPCTMACRALVEAAGGFDESLISGHDYDLWTRLALLSEASNIAEPLAAVRMHAGTHSRKWPPRALEGRGRSLEKVSALADARWQRLILRERRRNATALAASYLAHGARGEMLVSMGRSLTIGWREPRWWAANARTLLRAAAPVYRSGDAGLVR